ncbi:hypothetical protein [Dictyobacter halimunensis]|uniref:hypothetical protein n=1 Tax=Dictyobacter halimunensis TaxID=3026934 RepID=UPI0030C6C1B2
MSETKRLSSPGEAEAFFPSYEQQNQRFVKTSSICYSCRRTCTILDETNKEENFEECIHFDGPSRFWKEDDCDALAHHLERCAGIEKDYLAVAAPKVVLLFLLIK